MKLYYQDEFRTVYNKSCTDMSELPDESVQCCVTSPPYWGLRKYAGEQTIQWPDDTFYPYGLEPTPAMYVSHTISILEEIKRVLRPDGTVFWNIGDSYARNGGEPGGRNRKLMHLEGVQTRMGKIPQGSILKTKDLCLIPFRVAISAQEVGWWVRSVIIWSKNNPMPESVKDRPTESHEYILLLTKSERYYWDQEAVREPVAVSTIGRGLVDFGGAKGRDYNPDKSDPNFRNGTEQWGRTFDYRESCANGRNLRSVWAFPTRGYPEAHFATFPPELPERCIKAGTPEGGCCAVCGKPYERVIEKSSVYHDGETDCKNTDNRGNTRRLALMRQAARERGEEYFNHVKTLGWQPGCNCQTDKTPVPAMVLDPFCGSGTTLEVSTKLGRRSIGYEISEEYCQLIVKRNRQGALV